MTLSSQKNSFSISYSPQDLLRNFISSKSKQDNENLYLSGTIHNINSILIIPNIKINQSDHKEINHIYADIIHSNDVYYTFRNKTEVKVEYRLIYPASPSHIKKYMSNLLFIKETYKTYKSKVQDTKISWIQNIIKGNTTEKIYYDDTDFILIKNFKWTDSNISNLSLLLIFKDNRLRTIRDLCNISILKKAKELIKNKIIQFKLRYEDVVVFFHYPPTYNQLHLHIMNVNLQCGSMSVTRARLLEDVIYNMELDIDYYKRSIFISTKKE